MVFGEMNLCNGLNAHLSTEVDEEEEKGETMIDLLATSYMDLRLSPRNSILEAIIYLIISGENVSGIREQPVLKK